MNQLSPEEEKAILASSPRGTWALLLVILAAMAVGWAALFVLFLSHGPVS